MLMRIEKTLIMMLLLLFASPILQAGHQASTEKQLPGETTEQSNDDIRQRAAMLAAQAYELAESLLSQPSLNELKKGDRFKQKLFPLRKPGVPNREIP